MAQTGEGVGSRGTLQPAGDARRLPAAALLSGPTVAQGAAIRLPALRQPGPVPATTATPTTAATLGEQQSRTAGVHSASSGGVQIADCRNSGRQPERRINSVLHICK